MRKNVLADLLVLLLTGIEDGCSVNVAIISYNRHCGLHAVDACAADSVVELLVPLNVPKKIWSVGPEVLV